MLLLVETFLTGQTTGAGAVGSNHNTSRRGRRRCLGRRRIVPARLADGLVTGTTALDGSRCFTEQLKALDASGLVD